MIFDGERERFVAKVTYFIVEISKIPSKQKTESSIKQPNLNWEATLGHVKWFTPKK